MFLYIKERFFSRTDFNQETKKQMRNYSREVTLSIHLSYRRGTSSTIQPSGRISGAARAGFRVSTMAK